ncbi:MAG: AAA family ATPase, partial [FCB group bacterium]|nr:AAA family ATPase [FCB group bacterium]
MPFRIVITGAPAAAKTKFIERLKSHSSFSDFIFFNELARQLLEEHPEYRNFPRLWHQEIYQKQVAREQAAREKSFITDRGTVDAFAFHPHTLEDVKTTLEKEYRRYDAVIQLGTTASLGEAYYIGDEIRKEGITDALIIEEKLKQVWRKHPHYYFIKAETDL